MKRVVSKFFVLLWLFPLLGEQLTLPAEKELFLGQQVIPGSVKIYCGDIEIPSGQFVATASGTVRFLAPPPCDTVRIEFVPLERIFPPTESHYRMWGTGEANVSTQMVQTSGDSSQEEVTFRTSGTLLRGLRISNTGEVNSTSSLHFQAEGDLAGDVHISALLSDEGSPIQPEGNSLELSELDKVLIELTSPHINASFGDIDLNFTGGNLLNLKRRIQGVSAEVNYSGVRAQGFGSILRGKFNTVEFTATEGNQGPYPLWGEDGERNIVIIAGSERVWLNGELMTRGENNDYIMDYNLAQITFTNRHPLGPDDRIVVDFQYVSEDYVQGFFGVGTEVTPSRNSRFGIFSIWRNDDTKNPLVEISDSVRELLAECGDAVPDSLSAPQYLQVTSITGKVNLGNLAISGEYSLSDFDKNKFSSLNDDDNWGEAFSAAGTLGIGAVDGLKLFGAVRRISHRYESPGRIDPVEFNRQWNLNPADSVDDIIWLSGAEFFETGKNIHLTFWGGERFLGEQRARRVQINSNWNDLVKSAFNFAAIQMSRRLSGTLKFNSPSKLPAFGLETRIEQFVSDTIADTLLGEVTPTVGGRAGKFGLKLRGGMETKFLRRRHEWGDFYRVFQPGVDLDIPGGRISYTRRFFLAADSSAGKSQITDLASVSFARTMAGMDLSAKYQLSRSQSEQLEKVYVYVGPGEGSYRWDNELGEYVADPDGDYILEYRTTGEFTPVTRADFSSSFSADMGWFPYGASVHGEVNFHSENKRGNAKAYYLNPSHMFTDDSLSAGTFSSSGRVVFLKRTAVSLVISSTYRKSAYRIYSSGPEFSRSFENSLSLSGKIWAGLLASIEIGVQKQKNFRPSLSRWVDAYSYTAEFSISRRFFNHVRGKTRFDLKKITDFGTLPRTEAFLLNPGVELTGVWNRFVFKISGEWADLSSSQAVLPYELSNGWYVGDNWRWENTLTYRAGAKTEISLIYRGEKKAHTPTKHIAEARVRVMF